MHGEIKKLDRYGDTVLAEWDTENLDSVIAAKAVFDAMKASANLAFAQKEGSEESRLLHTFDPTETRILVTPAIVGG